MKYVKLKELCSIKHGYAFKGQYISQEENSNILVTPGNFYIGGGFKIDKCKYYTNNNDIPEEYILKPNDLIVTMTDLSKEANALGYSALIPDNKKKRYLHNQRIGLIQNIREEYIDKDYLYWFMRTTKYHNEIVATSTGTTVHHTSPNRILKIEIPLFDVNTQKKIGKILNLIDKKIERNIHTNNNLYEIGRTLYKEYFENEKYTRNYEIKQLNEVTKNNRNRIDKNKKYKVLSAVNTGNLVLSDEYFDKQVYSKDIGKYLNVNKHEFAYNPARINIGSIGLNTFDFNCCVSPVYVTFSVDTEYIDFFDFYFKSKKFNSEVTLRASGSVRQALNYNDFGMIKIPYPSKEMIDKFNNSYRKIKNRINKNKAKMRNLEQLRDILLPKLMNGEIDIDKIEI